jgi:hypothetical protein
VCGYLMPAMGAKGAARLGHGQSDRYPVDADVQERADACSDRSGSKVFLFPFAKRNLSSPSARSACLSLNSLLKIQLNSKSDGLLGSQILPSEDLFRPTDLAIGGSVSPYGRHNGRSTSKFTVIIDFTKSQWLSADDLGTRSEALA